MLVLALLVIACGGPPGRPSTDPDSRRALAEGDVVGFTGVAGNHAWRGIPYATPPVGPLRWRAPLPAPRWKDTLEALSSGRACTQFASPRAGGDVAASGVVGSEDCLYLDVYAPRRPPDAIPEGAARLPVMVWIHGGPAVGRAGFYDAGELAAAGEVVVVVIGYRMGPLGWLHHRSLRSEAATAAERSGNFGLLDQIHALEWVRDRIAAFGGDSGNVTVFGEGFGAFSVRNLLLSPLASGLFHRAILQSNPSWGFTPASITENFADDPQPGSDNSSNEALATLMQRDGIVRSQGEAKARIASMSDTELAAYLRGKSDREIVGAYVDDPETHRGGYDFPPLLHDGFVLPPEPPMESLARGAYHRVPLMLGTTRDEIKLLQALSPAFVRWRLDLAPYAIDPERYAASAKHHADACRATTVDGIARLLAERYGHAVFAFRFDWDEEPNVPFLYDGPFLLGAAHGLIGPFVFGHFHLGPQTSFVFGRGSEDGRRRLAAQMMSYWARFAEAGEPGRGRHGDLLEWTAWDGSRSDAPKALILDTHEGGGLRMSSEAMVLDDVLEAALVDPRFADAREFCAALAPWGCVPDDRYATIDVCRRYPKRDYPWSDEDVAR